MFTVRNGEQKCTHYAAYSSVQEYSVQCTVYSLQQCTTVSNNVDDVQNVARADLLLGGRLLERLLHLDGPQLERGVAERGRVVFTW